MKKQLLKQRYFHSYLISTGTASTAARICFNPSCSLGLTLGFIGCCGLENKQRIFVLIDIPVKELRALRGFLAPYEAKI